MDANVQVVNWSCGKSLRTGNQGSSNPDDSRSLDHAADFPVCPRTEHLDSEIHDVKRR